MQRTKIKPNPILSFYLVIFTSIYLLNTLCCGYQSSKSFSINEHKIRIENARPVLYSNFISSNSNIIINTRPKLHLNHFLTLTSLKNSRSDRGWSNDNFLDALQSGRDSQELEKANEEYYRQSEARSVMRDRLYQTRMNQDEEIDNEEFRDPNPTPEQIAGMYEKEPQSEDLQKTQIQKQMQNGINTSSEPNINTNDVSCNNSNMQQMQELYMMQLQAWQQQMTAFAQFAAANPDAAKNLQMPPMPQPPVISMENVHQETQPSMASPTPPPKPMDTTNISSSLSSNNQENINDPYAFIPKPPKEANRDAYEIQNTADVYFAQLKRDSTVRAIARKAGDIETANKPFSDPGVHAIKGILSDELQEARRERRQKGNEQFTTSRDEMLFAYEDTPDIDESVKRSSGVSYRQKMEEMKRNRTKKSGNGDPETLFKISKEDEIPVRNAADFLSDTNSDLSTSPPSSNVPFSIPKPKPISLDPPSSSDMKSDLENSKLESPPTSNPFASFSNSKTPSKTSMTSASTTQSSFKAQQRTEDFSLPVTNDLSASPPINAPSMEDDNNIRQTIRTLMGLLLKHRGGPGFGPGRLKAMEAERLEKVYDDVKTILYSELKEGENNETELQPHLSSTAEKIAPAYPQLEQTMNRDIQASSTGSTLTTVEGTMACVQAAVEMYKSSTFANDLEKIDLLTPVRGALMGAVDVISKAIAEKELEIHRGKDKPDGSIDDGDDVRQGGRSSPTTTTYLQQLEQHYHLIDSMKGGKKFGLKDLTIEEIALLKDSLYDIRGILMEELENGSFEKNQDISIERTTITSSSISNQGSNTSPNQEDKNVLKYKKMLKDAQAS
mmetsp:Transcript_17810/g.25167  ORF Transcript_17810/g.25167 Transcript_17810/m.25167 type:complete len:839 (-) Transcript_17810:198-2714(-)